MSKNSKTILWIVIILVVLGLIGWIYAIQHSSDNAMQGSEYESGIQSTTTTISSTTTSNSDLNNDMTKVDAQMKGLDQDSTAANQSSY